MEFWGIGNGTRIGTRKWRLDVQVGNMFELSHWALEEMIGIKVLCLIVYYCGLHWSSGMLKASCADGMLPTRSDGGEPASCICAL